MAETKFTLAEVSSKDGRQGAPAWMIYKDSVYDVTSYVEQHPGGRDEILDEVGKDATSAFDAAGHSSDSRIVLAKYKIGEIIEKERKYDANGKKIKHKSNGNSKFDSETERSCLSCIFCGLV